MTERTIRKAVSGCMLLMLLFQAIPAGADTAVMSGSVVSVRSEYVLAPIGGLVEELGAEEGDLIEAGQTLVTLNTSTVYAQESGTVRLFGEKGDQVDTVAARYGAVAVIEPDPEFILSASTQRAYDSTETRIIHPGEKVYLRSTGNNGRSGRGQVTTVNGSQYQVEITSGSFELNEAVYVYRSSEHTNESRIGQGTVGRRSLSYYTGSGSIVSFLVKNGAKVKKGDALFETLDGTFDGYVMTGREIPSPWGGVLARLQISRGSTIAKNTVLAEIWPEDAMRLVVKVSETDLKAVEPGTRVNVEFDALYKESFGGTVEKVSMKAEDTASGDAQYAVTILLDSMEGIRYGMHATAVVETDGE